MSRLRTYIAGLPLLTVAIATSCAAIYVVDALFLYGELAKWWELRTEHVLYRHQVYRLATYPLPHLNLPHLFFNLIFFLPVSSYAERHMGTLCLAVTLCTVFTFLPALLYCAAMLGLSAIGAGAPLLVEHDVIIGISGWVFAMMVGELVNRTRDGEEMPVGILGVSPIFFSIVLLLFLEGGIPGSSFLGHLCALLSGYLYAHGYISKFLPSTELYQRLEGTRILASLTGLGGFVSVEHGRTLLPLFNASNIGVETTASVERARIHTTSALPIYAAPTILAAPPAVPTPSFPGVGQRLED